MGRQLCCCESESGRNRCQCVVVFSSFSSLLTPSLAYPRCYCTNLLSPPIPFPIPSSFILFQLTSLDVAPTSAQEALPFRQLLLLLGIAEAVPFAPVCTIWSFINRDRVDVHRIGVPLWLPLRRSSKRFAVVILSGIHKFTLTGSEAGNYQAGMSDFTTCSCLPLIEGL